MSTQADATSYEALRMKLMSNIEHDLMLLQDAFSLVVHHPWLQQAQAEMEMLFIVPTKKIPDRKHGYLRRRRSRFKSGRPDQKYLVCFLLLKPRLWNSGRQEFSIRKSFTFWEFAT